MSSSVVTVRSAKVSPPALLEYVTAVPPGFVTVTALFTVTEPASFVTLVYANRTSRSVMFRAPASAP